MGNVESEGVRKQFATEVHSLFRPHARLHQVNGVQHGLFLAFFTNLTSACLKCGPVLIEHQNYVFNKSRIATPLPHDESLMFNKNEIMRQWQHDAIYGLFLAGAEPVAFNHWKTLRTDVSEIPPMYRDLYVAGFLDTPNIVPNRWMAFFGRQSAVLENCLEEIEHENFPDVKETKECRQLVRSSKEALALLGTVLNKKLREDQATVWVLPPGIPDLWKTRPAFRDMTYEGDATL